MFQCSICGNNYDNIRAASLCWERCNEVSWEKIKPKFKPRRLYDENILKGYMESDDDFVKNNWELVIWLLKKEEEKMTQSFRSWGSSTVVREWFEYERKATTWMTPYNGNPEELEGVSVSPEDQDEINGDGPYGMIARNEKNHSDKWYVAHQYFIDNYRKKTN